MCGRLMGKFWEYMGSCFSLLAVTGAAVVYWVLMTNFLYNTVTFIYGKLNNFLYLFVDNVKKLRNSPNTISTKDSPSIIDIMPYKSNHFNTSMTSTRARQNNKCTLDGSKSQVRIFVNMEGVGKCTCQKKITIQLYNLWEPFLVLTKLSLFFTDKSTGNSHIPGNASHGVYCPSNPDSKDVYPGINDSGLFNHSGFYDPSPNPNETFDYFWNSSTVACYLVILLPLISLRSITFFTKFNSLGEFS